VTTDKETNVQDRHRQQAKDRLEGQVAHAIARARDHGHAVSLIVLDVDQFRQINETFGHTTGDQILAELPEIIGRQSNGPVTRWGGEEFAVLCPGSGLEAASALAERIRSTIAHHSFAEAGAVTVSLGVATHQPGERAMDTIERAIAATYRAKNEGRNRVVTG
jgi:diguanylate cyclase (GGDEF)-like protein